MRFPAFFIVMCCVGAPALFSAEYFVDLAGSDGRTGAADSPFRTIQKAAEVAKAGDTVTIRAGVYREAVRPARSGTAERPIVYQAAPGAKVIEGWRREAGEVWSAPLKGDFFASAMNQALQVFVDGVMVDLARWPNATTRVEAYPLGVIPPVSLSTPPKSTFGRFISKKRDEGRRMTTGVFEDEALPEKAPAGDFEGAQFHHGARAGNFRGMITTDTAAGGDARGYEADGAERFPWRGEAQGEAQGVASSEGIVLQGLDVLYPNHFTDRARHFLFLWGMASGLVLSGENHRLEDSRVRRAAGNGVLLLGRGHLVKNSLFEDIAYAAVECAAVNTGGPTLSEDDEIAYNTIRRAARSGMTPRVLGNSTPEAPRAFTTIASRNTACRIGTWAGSTSRFATGAFCASITTWCTTRMGLSARASTSTNVAGLRNRITG